MATLKYKTSGGTYEPLINYKSSSAINVVQDMGNSMTDVMSQSAVTKEISEALKLKQFMGNNSYVHSLQNIPTTAMNVEVTIEHLDSTNQIQTITPDYNNFIPGSTIDIFVENRSSLPLIISNLPYNNIFKIEPNYTASFFLKIITGGFFKLGVKEEPYINIISKVIQGELINKQNVKAGDFCCYDENLKEKVFVRTGGTINYYTKKIIGIVVIPTSHDVYGTGECAIMSLQCLTHLAPNRGQCIGEIVWGSYDDDVANLKNYNRINYIGQGTELNNGIVQGTHEIGSTYLPSDNFNGVKSLDNISYYYDGKISNYQIPSPYLSNGARNESYYTTSKSEFNVFSDFNGKENTQKMIDLSTGQTNWKSDAKIINSYDKGYYPAACSSWRYCPPYTKQGDWYLPSCGELGYYIARFKAIKKSISYLSMRLQMSLYSYAISSTEYNNKSYVTVDVNTGKVMLAFKNVNNHNTLAFMRI